MPVFGVLFLAFLLATGIHTLTLREELYLTHGEQAAFDKFKAQALPIITTEYMKSDLVLKKYFRFCDYNENKTLEVLKDNIQWRLDQGFETLPEDEITNYRKLYPFSFLKDKLGRCVLFLVLKYSDLSAATKSIELTAKFKTFCYRMYEEAYIQGVSNLTGATASGIVIVVDVIDADIRHYCGPCLQILRDIAALAELRWPDGLQAGYVVNAPSLLRPAMTLVKGMFSKKLQESMFPFDLNDAEWMPVLLEFMDADKIPGDLYILSKQQVTNHSVPAPAFNFFVAKPISNT